MATAAQLRKLVLSLPEVEEKSHFEQPDFRVRNKIFAGLSRDETTGSLKLTPEIQAGVIDAKPAAFYPAAGAWGRSGWTHYRLAELEVGALRDLLHEAWSLVAPKRLVAAHSGSPARVEPKTTAGKAKPKPAKRKPRRKA